MASMKVSVQPIPSRTVPIREVIGRTNTGKIDFTRSRAVSSIDYTRADYEFWDKLRNGLQPGYKLSGLFVNAVCEILSSWVLGESLKAKVIDGTASEESIAHTETLLNAFLKRYFETIKRGVTDMYALGDWYIIVNADGTLSVPSPDTVTMTYDELQHKKPVKAVITTELPEATITDTYTEENRILTVKLKRTKDRAERIETFEYDNLIGKLPVVHIANDAQTNEVNGKPMLSAMLWALARYDALLENALDGGELLGVPIPVASGVGSKDRFVEDNSTGDDYDEEGNLKPYIGLDQLSMLIIEGEKGKFEFASPGNGFTGDVSNLLKLLFLLILEHTRIPEVVWGNELGQARASSVEQMRTFYTYVYSRRIQLEGRGYDPVLEMDARGGLLAVLDVWLSYRALTDPQVVNGQTYLVWDKLDIADEAMKYQWTVWADSTGKITRATALAQSDLVDNPEAEIEKADQEAQAQPVQPTANPMAEPDADIPDGAEQDAEPELPDEQSELNQWLAIAVREGVPAALNYRTEGLDPDVAMSIRFGLTSLTEADPAQLTMYFDAYRRMYGVTQAA